MHQFKFISHTADLSIQVKADTLEELFLGGLLGMNQILKADFCDDPRERVVERTVRVRSMDATTLLVDFLSDVLTHTYLDRCIFCELDIRTLDEHTITATIRGRVIDHFDDDIKAVTYHDAEVVQRNGVWQSRLVFDI